MADLERAFWNEWNTRYRESEQGPVSMDQARFIHRWLRGCSGISILDAGCGTGWFCSQLTRYGRVVGTDLADEVIARARDRVPDATFVAGDIMAVDVGGDFDVIVSLEVLSHVPDQTAFLARLRELLKPGGRLLLATQNRPVLERLNRIAPPGPGQLRRWVDRAELRQLLAGASFRVDQVRVVTPIADHGVPRVLAKLARLLRAQWVLERFGFGWTIMTAATKAE